MITLKMSSDKRRDTAEGWRRDCQEDRKKPLDAVSQHEGQGPFQGVSCLLFQRALEKHLLA